MRERLAGCILYTGERSITSRTKKKLDHTNQTVINIQIAHFLTVLKTITIDVIIVNLEGAYER